MHIPFRRFLQGRQESNCRAVEDPTQCMKLGMLPEMAGARNSLLAGTDELGKATCLCQN